MENDKATHKPVKVKNELSCEPVKTTKQQHEILQPCQRMSLNNVMSMLIVMYALH